MAACRSDAFGHGHRVQQVAGEPADAPDKDAAAPTLFDLPDQAAQLAVIDRLGGTDVVVTARVTGGSVAVSVEDRGRGIADADLPFIFDEFFQAPERSEPGAGLGLAIARELTEAHGGRIDVSSRVGEGACFTVTL